MAIIVPTIQALAAGVLRITWGPMQTGDTGLWVAFAKFSDKTVTIEGDVVTTVALEGSNNPLGTNPRTLVDVDGTTLVNAAGDFTVKQNPLLMRPKVTTGTNVVFSLTAR